VTKKTEKQPSDQRRRQNQELSLDLGLRSGIRSFGCHEKSAGWIPKRDQGIRAASSTTRATKRAAAVAVLRLLLPAAERQGDHLGTEHQAAAQTRPRPGLQPRQLPSLLRPLDHRRVPVAAHIGLSPEISELRSGPGVDGVATITGPTSRPRQRPLPARPPQPLPVRVDRRSVTTGRPRRQPRQLQSRPLPSWAALCPEA